MKKKGFQLSISVIVIIIIGVVLLGFGIWFLNKFIGGIGDIKAELDERTDQQLSLLLESGERVAIPFNSFEVRRGESEVVGIGFFNIEDGQRFFIDVQLSNAFDKEDNNIIGFSAADWVRYDSGEIYLEQNEQHKTALLFTAPKNATSGTYIFDIDVRTDAGSYGLKKVYFTVQ